jgi:hypothetical protein
MHAVTQLKRLFRIAEGDFTQFAREEVAELLATQLERALADRQVDDREAVQKVRLQESFGLGYDEFLELTRPLFDEVAAQLWEEGVEKGWYVDELERRIAALGTVYSVQWQIDRASAPVYEAIEQASAAEEKQLRGEVRSRHISQDVKDQVWRRDQGRCVECGSQERLEFDHIIPFARGGANTYRNIQLLCEPCNRTKSASIG